MDLKPNLDGSFYLKNWILLILFIISGCSKTVVEEVRAPSSSAEGWLDLTVEPVHLKVDKESSANTQGKKSLEKSAPSPQWKQVLINVVQVAVEKDNRKWIVVNSNKQTLDLIALSQNASAILGSTRLEPGVYTKIRLKLQGEAIGVDMSGRRIKIQVPLEALLGVIILGKFEVKPGVVTRIALHFDPDKSIIKLGPFYILIPIICMNGIDEDIVAPIVSVINPDISVTKNSDQLVKIEFFDPNLDVNTLSIRVDGIESKHLFTVSSNTAEATLSFADGEHRIEASVSDTFQNIGSATPKVFRVDTVAPVIALESTQIMSRVTNPLVRAQLVDDGSGIQASMLKVFVGAQDVTAQFTLQGDVLEGRPILAQGVHVLKIQIADKAGNISESVGSITVDNTAPTITFSPPTGTFLSTLRPDLLISIADNLSGINQTFTKIFVNAVDRTSEFTITSSGIQGSPDSDLVVGENTFKVIAQDTLGNESTLTAKLILGMTAPALTINPADGSTITSRQPSIFVGFSGPLLNLNSFKFLLNNEDISSQFTVNSTGATLFAARTLPLGVNTVQVSLENIFGQAQSLSSVFNVTTPPVEPDPDPLPPTPPISNEDTIPFDETRSVAIDDPTSPAHGSVAIIPKGAIDENIDLKIEVVDPDVIENAENIQPPGSFGPILKFEPAMEFNIPVMVGVPFDLSVYRANNLTPKDLVVVRQNAQTHEFEVLTPFSIDFERGIMYVQTSGFSFFWGGYNPYFLNVQFTSPTQMVATSSIQKYAEVRSQQVQVTGTVSTNLGSVSATCVICPPATVINLTPDPANSLSTKFNIDLDLANTLQEIRIAFRAGSTESTSIILFNVLPPFPTIPTEEIPICDQTGKLCNHAGNGNVGYSSDGSIANLNPINVNTEGNELFDISRDSQGRIVWIEPTNLYPICSGNKIELAVRRVGFDGKFETITKFTLNSVQGGGLCGEQLQDIEVNIAAQDDHIFIPISSQEFVGAFGQEKFYHRLFKVNADGSATALPVTIDYGTALAPAPNNILYVKTAGTQGNGVYKFNLTNSQLTYLGGTTSATVVSPDGTNISNFEVSQIKDIAFYNNELYFTQPNANCIRKFNSNWNVVTVGGICNRTLGAPADDVNALTTHLGKVSQIEIDSQGNIFFSENLPTRRFRVIRKDNGVVTTIAGGGLQPLSITNMPVDAKQVAIPLDYRYYEAFTIDNFGNFFALGNSFIYKVAQPAPVTLINNPSASNPISAPSTTVPHVDAELNSENLEKILNNSQSKDGYWDFEEKYAGDASIEDDSVRRLLATEKALELYKALGKENSVAVERAINWIVNQEYEATSLIAKQLKILSSFPTSAAASNSVRSGRQQLLISLGDRYRPPFFGWGSDQYSLTNNLDTSDVMSALISANKIYSPDVGHFVRMSDYQAVIIKILDKQFTNQSGVNLEGGWGITGKEHLPTTLTTSTVCDALIGYAKLPDGETKIIEATKKTEFLALRSTHIPAALKKALKFLLSMQRLDGSFGSVGETAKVVRILKTMKDSGLTPTSHASIDSGISNALNFLNNASMSTLDLGDLALLTDHMSNLDRTIAAADDIVPDSSPSNSVDLGTSKDGALSVSGVFNLNENSSGNRRRPDGVALKVSNVASGTSLEVENFVNGDIEVNDEVIVYSAQGTLGVGNYEFSKVIGVDTMSNPVRLTLQSNLVNSYSVDDKIILQRVPHYSKINPANPLVITAKPWNGKIGGLVVVRVAGTISSNVSIQASGLGFRGGRSRIEAGIHYSQQGEGISGAGNSSATSLGSNGCGGGNASNPENLSGGGGSYGSSGSVTDGHNNNAVNGFTFGSSQVTKIYMGCAGGSGVGNTNASLSAGGSGGGVIIIFANSFNVTGLSNYVRADAQAGIDASNASLQQFGAGGGSGGTILLNIKQLSLGTNGVSAIGGNSSMGSGNNPGYQGGDGRIRINYINLNGNSYPLAGSDVDGIIQTTPLGFGASF